MRLYQQRSPLREARGEEEEGEREEEKGTRTERGGGREGEEALRVSRLMPQTMRTTDRMSFSFQNQVWMYAIITV